MQAGVASISRVPGRAARVKLALSELASRMGDISKYFPNRVRDSSTSLGMTKLKSFWMPVRIFQAAFALVFKKLVNRGEHDRWPFWIDP